MNGYMDFIDEISAIDHDCSFVAAGWLHVFWIQWDSRCKRWRSHTPRKRRWFKSIHRKWRRSIRGDWWFWKIRNSRKFDVFYMESMFSDGRFDSFRGSIFLRCIRWFKSGFECMWFSIPALWNWLHYIAFITTEIYDRFICGHRSFTPETVFQQLGAR